MRSLTSMTLGLAITAGTIGIAGAAEQRTLHMCAHGDKVRMVEVVQDPNATPVCEVWYEKPSEGVPRQRLWSADNELGYCAPKADSFLAKLDGWGWTCSPVGDDTASTDPAEAAMTGYDAAGAEQSEAVPISWPEN